MSAVSTPPRSTALVRKLSQVEGLGTVKQKNLEAAFATEPELRAASEANLRRVPKVGPGLAKRLHGVLSTYDGTTLVLPPPKWRGQERVPMWDTRASKAVPTRRCPTEAEAEAWLTAHPHCARYTRQDLQMKGPRLVPDANQMTEQHFLDFCEQPGSADEFARLEQTSAARLEHAIPHITRRPALSTRTIHRLKEYGLKILAVAAAAAGGSSAAPDAPPGSSVFDALSRAARPFEQEQAVTQQELKAAAVKAVPRRKVDPTTARARRMTETQPKAVEIFTAANTLLNRPIWVFTGVAFEQNVLIIDSKRLPSTVDPIRLAECGGAYHVLIEASAEAEAAAAEAEPAETVVFGESASFSSEEGVEPEAAAPDEAHLHDLKDELDTCIKDTLATIDGTLQSRPAPTPARRRALVHSHPAPALRRD